MFLMSALTRVIVENITEPWSNDVRFYCFLKWLEYFTKLKIV